MNTIIEEDIKMMEIPNKCTNIYRNTPSYIYGKDMHSYITNSIYNDWCKWYFPKGIQEKIKDDQLYLVWYNFHDSSDPMDSSCSYEVYYIEKTPKHIQNMLETKTIFEKELKKYQSKYENK